MEAGRRKEVYANSLSWFPVSSASWLPQVDNRALPQTSSMAYKQDLVGCRLKPPTLKPRSIIPCVDVLRVLVAVIKNSYIPCGEWEEV